MSAVEEAPARRPQPAPEMDPLSVIVEAYIEVEGPKKGRRLLKAAGAVVARRSPDPIVMDFLTPAEREARTFEQRQTADWFRANLPAWLAKLRGR